MCMLGVCTAALMVSVAMSMYSYKYHLASLIQNNYRYGNGVAVHPAAPARMKQNPLHVTEMVFRPGPCRKTTRCRRCNARFSAGDRVRVVVQMVSSTVVYKATMCAPVDGSTCKRPKDTIRAPSSTSSSSGQDIRKFFSSEGGALTRGTST